MNTEAYADVEPAPAPPRRTWRRWALIVGLSVVQVYVVCCILIALLQAKLIYFPAREYKYTPADIGLAFEDLTLTTSDGEQIAAWYVPHAEPSATVLFCHGNAGNIADRLAALKQWHTQGFAVLILDYRGYGRSTGSPGEQGTYLDAEAAWQYLTAERKLSPGQIVLYGRSLGGAVAIELASRHEPAALLVECTFTSMVDVGRSLYPLLPVSLILVHRYESVEKVPHIRCPKLFVHGTDDELVPVRLGQALFHAAAEPKTYIETPGGHNEAGWDYDNDTLARTLAFLTSALSMGEH